MSSAYFQGKALRLSSLIGPLMLMDFKTQKTGFLRVLCECLATLGGLYTSLRGCISIYVRGSRYIRLTKPLLAAF
jgi:hypothetical protein